MIGDLKDSFEKGKILEISNLQQEIASNQSKDKHLQEVANLIKNQAISQVEKLKMVMLFAFRYEGDPSILHLTEQLGSQGVSNELTGYIEALTKYAGVNKRKCDVLSNKNLLSRGKKSFMNLFKDVPSVLCRHKSFLGATLEKILKQEAVEFMETVASRSANEPAKTVAFCFGGVTLQEYRETMELAGKLNKKIVLGGTSLHNSKSFLAELGLLK